MKVITFNYFINKNQYSTYFAYTILGSNTTAEFPDVFNKAVEIKSFIIYK